MGALLAGVSLLHGVSCVSVPVDDPREARAEASERVGSWTEAAGLWTQIYLDSGSRNLEAGRLAARASLVAGRPEEALFRLNDLLARTPGEPRLLEMRGSAREGLNQPAAARADYEAALLVEPKLPRALSRLGALDVAEGDLELGLARLSAGVALDPRDGEAQFSLGVASAGAGLLDQAAEAFEAAFQAGEPDAPVALARRLEAARLLQGDPRCARWLAPILEAYPQHTEALWRLGQSEFAGGQRADGLRHLARAAESDPGDVAALVAYATGLSLAGRAAEAEAVIEHTNALDLTPAEQALLEGLTGRNGDAQVPETQPAPPGAVTRRQ